MLPVMERNTAESCSARSFFVRLEAVLLLIFLVVGLCACGVNADPDANNELVNVAPEPEETLPPRTVYDISISVDTGRKLPFEASDGDDTAARRMSGDSKALIYNDSGDTWNTAVFRDYTASVLAIVNAQNHYKYYDETGIERTFGEDIPYYYSNISGVFSESGEALEFTVSGDDNSVITVTLAEPLEPAERCTVRIVYDTVVYMTDERCAWQDIGRYTGSSPGEDIMIALGVFYPVLAVYEDGVWQCGEYFADGECFYSKCADYTVTVELPPEFVVISGGRGKSRLHGENIVWTLSGENMRDFMLVISDALTVISYKAGDDGGTLVHSCYYSSDAQYCPNSKLGMYMLAYAASAIECFSHSYGEYPYDEFIVIETPFTFSGMEFARGAWISAQFARGLGDDMTATSQNKTFTSTVRTMVHETAHEWFYAVVGNDQYSEAWLDESFASFSEILFVKELYGEDAAQTLADEYAAALALYCPGGVYVDLPYDGFAAAGADYVTAVYKGGACYLYELYKAVGEKKFLSFIKEYYSSYAMKEASTAGFVSLLYETFPDDAEVRVLTEKYIRYR